MNYYRQSLDLNPGERIPKNIQFIFETFGVPNSIIEIGTFEGVTAFSISDAYSSIVPDMKIYCIDPHIESFDLSSNMSMIKENFLHNLSVCQNKNIEYINKFSEQGLIDLVNRKVSAQFIYVDGDHKASSVLADLVLSFILLPVGGVILCDDANWSNSKHNGLEDSANMAPRLGIENFIQCNWHRIKLIKLPNGSQTAFEKTKD